MCPECLSDNLEEKRKINGETFINCKNCGHKWAKELCPFDDPTQDSGFGR